MPLYQNLNLHITGDVQYFATTTQEPFLIPGYEESCRMSRRDLAYPGKRLADLFLAVKTMAYLVVYVDDNDDDDNVCSDCYYFDGCYVYVTGGNSDVHIDITVKTTMVICQ